MSINGIGDGNSASGYGVTATSSTQQENQTMDRQTFGAAVVSETLDLMNTTSSGRMDSSYDFQKKVLGAFAGTTTSGGGSTAPMDKETFGASVVTSTLDAMNTDMGGTTDSSYDFQTKVLGAYAEGGNILNTKG